MNPAVAFVCRRCGKNVVCETDSEYYKEGVCAYCHDTRMREEQQPMSDSREPLLSENKAKNKSVNEFMRREGIHSDAGSFAFGWDAARDFYEAQRTRDVQELESLRAFAKDMLRPTFDGYDFGGGEIQDTALKHGLLREVTRTEPCGENCTCAELDAPPFTCLEFAPCPSRRIPGRGRQRAMSTDRPLPHSLESEQAALGSILCDPKLAPQIFGIVRPEEFYSPAFALIAATMRELDNASQPVDKIAVANALNARGKLESAGGPATLSQLMDTVQTSSTALYHARLIAEKAALRRLWHAGQKIQAAAYNGESDVAATLAECDSLLRDAIGSTQTDGVSLDGALREIYQEVSRAVEGENPPALMTPWHGFNRLVGGMHPGELIVCAAAPGTGKSAWAIQVANHAARTRGQALVFALEMGTTDTVRRMLSSHAQLDLRALRRGEVSRSEMERIGGGIDDLCGLPMFFYGAVPRKSVADVRRICRAKLQDGPISVVVIDHPGYLREAHSGSKTATKHERLEYVYLELRLIAQEIGCPIIVVQHLNRAGMDGKPTLGVLRDGGNLEGHAHMVIFPYRPDPIAQPTVGELIVAKNRDGEVGVKRMEFHGARFEWREAEYQGTQEAA